MGLFFFTFNPVFLWLLIGTLILFSPYKKSKDKVINHHFNQMKRDARKYGLQVPYQKDLRSLLNRIYKKKNLAVKEYPQLKEEYDEIIDELWSSLSQSKKPQEWSRILNSVLAKWPGDEEVGATAIQDKLDKISELRKQWREARAEAHS